MKDCSEDEDFYVRHWQGSHLAQATHSVSFAPDSWLHSVFGSQAAVNSFHHMAIKQTAEGIEAAAGPFAAGVQWHPEMMHRQDKMLSLFKSFWLRRDSDEESISVLAG